jgi:hypothetical protein
VAALRGQRGPLEPTTWPPLPRSTKPFFRRVVDVGLAALLSLGRPHGLNAGTAGSGLARSLSPQRRQRATANGRPGAFVRPSPVTQSRRAHPTSAHSGISRYNWPITEQAFPRLPRGPTAETARGAFKMAYGLGCSRFNAPPRGDQFGHVGR